MLKVNMELVVALLEKAHKEEGNYRALASKIGRDLKTIHKIVKRETNTVELDTLNDIARYLCIPTTDLLEGEALDKLRGLPEDLQKKVEEFWFKGHSPRGGEDNNNPK